MISIGGKGSGRKPKFHDSYHRVTRKHQRVYYRCNRRAWNLSQRLHITMKEARHRLKQKR